jgi:hypothetical protein
VGRSQSQATSWVQKGVDCGPQEVNAVKEKAKHHRFVALLLDMIIFVFQRADESVGKVRSGEGFVGQRSVDVVLVIPSV